jgi:tripartite-type tricarboxylate transporter receptor subunit TctC
MSARLSAAMLMFLSQISIAFAGEWPARPIHAIVPQSPGSALDIVPRALFEQLSASLRQPIIVENRIGAGNTIAMAARIFRQKLLGSPPGFKPCTFRRRARPKD